MPDLSHRKTRVPLRVQWGTSLVELMVGIAIALILLTGILTVMLRVSTEGGASVKATRLNQQLRGTMDLMTKELQRSGYVDWFDSYDANGDGALDNNDDVNSDGVLNILDFYESSVPAINTFGQVTLGGTCSGTTCSCILYSYDLDEDGVQNVDQFELFGLRLNDGAVEMRTAGSDHACDTGTWADITDSSIVVTDLTFALTYVDPGSSIGDSTVYSISGTESFSATPGTTCTPSVSGTYPGDDGTSDTICVWRRMVTITLSAELADDPGVTATLSTDVKLKNDYLDTQ